MYLKFHKVIKSLAVFYIVNPFQIIGFRSPSQAL